MSIRIKVYKYTCICLYAKKILLILVKKRMVKQINIKNMVNARKARGIE
jgi:hypothetical protein